ncbi:hypothetical protein BGZ67_003011 [Mortierella alpina]|nr:hypothetical protein BGZ67_003011 [Mortierella alpina]
MGSILAEAAATMVSPPVSPLPNSSDSSYSPASPQPFSLSPSPKINSIPQNAHQEHHAASPSETEMMASLDAVLSHKTTAASPTEATSDYYSSSLGGGSDNGHDESLSDGHALQSRTDTAPGQNAPPTLQQMGLDGLDDLELRMLLQNAYEVIQEKDRDLDMAAMMGQGLVETNHTLQAKYQSILTQLRQQRLHRPRQLTPPRTIILTPAPELAGGTIDAEDGDDNWVDFEPNQTALHSSAHHVHSSGTPGSSHHHVSFRRSGGGQGGGAILRSRSRQDVEKMATLEDLNTELQTKVDAITKELKQGRRQAFKRHRKAELELKMIKGELERTTVKVVDLEEQNGRLIEASRMIRMRRILLKNQLPVPGSIPGSTMANMAVEMQGDEATIQEMLAEDNRIFEELRDRLQSLERKNMALAHQKTDADKKVQQLAQDLAEVQKDHEELMTQLCGYSDLQTAYNEQSAHVRELENSIQELQNTISTMSSRLSQMNSPLMSPSEPSSPIQSLWRRDDADFKTLKTILHGSSPPPVPLKSPGLKGQRRPRRTLLAELESEWFRDVSFFGPPRVVTDQTIHLPGGVGHGNGPKSPKQLKNHRHDSESESFSDDTGGRVKGWRERIHQDMDEESACESSSCIRKRRNRFKYAGSDTDGGVGTGTVGHPLGDDDSDVERYHLRQRRRKRRASGSGGDDFDDDFDGEDDMSDCSDPHHLDSQGRPSTPGCCCHLYDEFTDYSYDDEDMMCDDEESVVGWAHFEDYDASSFGYDKYRDGYYMGRKSRGGILGMLQSVFLFVRLVMRWCRFIGILSTALAIAIYRGPDALLTDGH